MTSQGRPYGATWQRRRQAPFSHQSELLHQHTLGEVVRLIHVRALGHADIIAQQLQWDHRQAAHKVLVHPWDIDREIRVNLRPFSR